MSPAAITSAKYARLLLNATHLHISRSPFFPKSATEYNAHNLAYTDLLARKQRKILEYKIAILAARKAERVTSGKVPEEDTFKVNECELAYAWEDEVLPTEEEMMREVGWSVAFSPVLGEKTCFWAGGEEELTEGRVVEEGMRAFWPKGEEYKIEGEFRLRKTREYLPDLLLLYFGWA